MNTWTRLEKRLLPPPETLHWEGGALRVQSYTTLQKVVHYVENFFGLVGLLAIAPLTLVYDWFSPKQGKAPRSLSSQTPPTWPPEQRGFATSLFQTSGLGTRWSATPNLRGRSDWDGWMANPDHVLHPPGFDYRNFFTDVLSDPGPYIEMLQAQNVTAHRFSLEWAVLEPQQGETDLQAVALYRNFIEQLLKAGITPSITLSHFVVPDWFYQQGNFQKLENIDLYVRFALRAMELFPEVRDWWSFNELGVKAFQQTREVYPTDLPEGSSLAKRVHAAGISTRNMLAAHCKLHQAVERRYPANRLGVTHQWLQFDTASGNLLEKTAAYFFTKFGFTPVYRFFQDGRFSFEFPFMANIQFQIPKEEFLSHGRFLMRLGVQAYPKPMLKMGRNHGQTYPGLPHAIKNLPFFSFGSSCEPGGVVMRFGPRWKAERMDEILDEAFALTDEVYITEYGSDASVQKWGSPGFAFDDPAQAHYLKQLTERIRAYSARTLRKIQGIFCWSDLRRQLEWENGLECRLGLLTPGVDENRRLTGWTPTEASEYLKEAFVLP